MRTIVVLNKANGKPTIIHFDNVESIDYISDNESQFVYVSGRTVNVEMSLREIANTIRSTFNANINHLLLNYRSNAIGQFNNLDGTQVDIDSTGKVNPSSTTTPTGGTNNGGNTGSVGNGNNSGTTGNSVSNTGSTGTSNTGTTNVGGNTNNQVSNSDTTSGATNGSSSTTDNKDTSGSSGTDGKDTGSVNNSGTTGSDKQDSTDNKDKTDNTSNTGDSTGTVNSPGGTGNQSGSDSSTSNPANGDGSSGTQTGGSDTSSTAGGSGSTTSGQTDGSTGTSDDTNGQVGNKPGTGDIDSSNTDSQNDGTSTSPDDRQDTSDVDNGSSDPAKPDTGDQDSTDQTDGTEDTSIPVNDSFKDFVPIGTDFILLKPKGEDKDIKYNIRINGDTHTDLSFDDVVKKLGEHVTILQDDNRAIGMNIFSGHTIISIETPKPITQFVGPNSNTTLTGNKALISVGTPSNPDIPLGGDYVIPPFTIQPPPALLTPGTEVYPGNGIIFVDNGDTSSTYTVNINGNDVVTGVDRDTVIKTISDTIGSTVATSSESNGDKIVINKTNNTYVIKITNTSDLTPIGVKTDSNTSIRVDEKVVSVIFAPADGSDIVLPKLPDYEGKLVLTYMSTYEDMNTVLVDSIHSEEFKEFVKQRQINITVKENTNTFVMNSVGTYYLFGINKEDKSNWTSGTYLVDMDLNEPVDGYFFRGTGYPGPRDTVPDFTGLPVDGSDSSVIAGPDINYSITVSNYTDGDNAILFDKLTNTELTDFLQPYGITITNATPHTITLNSTRPEFDSIRIERLTHNGSAELELDIGNKFDFSQAEGSRAVTAYAPNLGNFKVSVKRRESGLVEEVIETRRLSDHYVSSALYSLGITVNTSIRNGINSDIVNITEFSNDARENISELIIEHPVYQSGERRFEGLDAFTTNTDYAVDSLFFGRKTIVIPIPDAIPTKTIEATLFNRVGSAIGSSQSTYPGTESANFNKESVYSGLGYANFYTQRYNNNRIVFIDANDTDTVDYLEIVDNGNPDGIVGDFGNREILTLQHPYNMNDLMRGYKSRQFVFTGTRGHMAD